MKSSHTGHYYTAHFLKSVNKSKSRHLSQPHATIYINSHLEVFYKKAFLKVSQKKERKTTVLESPVNAALIKKRLWHKRFPVNFAKLFWRQNTKCKCMQMFLKKVYETYICFVYIKIKLLVIAKKFIYYKCCSHLIIWL